MLDVDGDGDTAEVRREIGDPMHSSPFLLNYPGENAGDDARSRVFVGTNEGFLHAIDTDDGGEAFGFIPPELFANLDHFFRDRVVQRDEGTHDRPYGLDGEVTGWHDDTDRDGLVDAGEKAYVYVGMRRGGRNYYALDVSDPAAPSLAWVVRGGSGDFAELGQSWSTPVHTRMATAARCATCSCSAPATTPAATRGPRGKRRPPTAWGAVCSSSTRAPACGSPTSGRASTATWTTRSRPPSRSSTSISTGSPTCSGSGTPARASGASTSRAAATPRSVRASAAPWRPISAASARSPRAASTTRRTWRWCRTMKGMCSSTSASVRGWRAHPLDTIVEDRFYMLRTPDIFGPPRDEDGNVDYPEPATESTLFDATSATTRTAAASALERGWYIGFPADGEKVLGAALTVEGQVLFTSYVPDDDVADVCSVSVGGGRLYALDAITAEAVLDLDGSSTEDEEEELTLDDRSRRLRAPGIPAPVSVLLPESANPSGSDEVTLDVRTKGERIEIDSLPTVTRTYWAERGEEN